MLEIREVSISDLENAENIQAILEGYAKELIVKCGPKACAAVDIYKSLEKSGCFHVLGSYVDGVLCGFVTVLVTILPHYGVKMAVTESYFVSEESRKTGAGLRLLHEAEVLAKNKGAFGILVSSPYGGRLAEILPRIGFTETNRVFYKGFAHE